MSSSAPAKSRTTKIRYKLTLAIMSTVLILMFASTFINLKQLQEVIHRNYEQKGIDAVTLTHNLSFQRLIEVTENYTNFLTQDSNVRQAVFELISLGQEQDVVEILPQYASKLNLSFLEVIDLNGSIRYSTLNDASTGNYNILAPLVSSASEGLQVTRLSYEDKKNTFLIHSTSVIKRHNEAIAVLHGGYILDADLLSSLAADYGLALYNSNSALVSSNRLGAPPKNTNFISEVYSELVNHCFNAVKNKCDETFISSSFQNIGGISYLYTAMPVKLNNELPVGTLIVSHEMTFMEKELTTAALSDFTLFLILAFFAFLLSYYISQVIASPLVTLAGLIQKYGKGQSISFKSVKRNTYEIDSLVDAFRNMIDVRETAEEARQKSEEQVTLLLKSTGEAIFGIDKRGICTFANPACAQEVGVPSVSSLIGHDVFNIILGTETSHHDVVHAVLEAHCQGLSFSTEDIELKRLNTQESFPAELHVYPIYRDVELVGSVVTFSDISERKAIEQKSLQLNEELEQKVNQRTQELQTSLKQLQETQTQLVQSEKMASLGSLVAGVAHEINTPIGVGITASTHLEMTVERYLSQYNQGHLTKNDFEAFLKSVSEASHLISFNLMRAGELIKSFKLVAVDQSTNENRTFFITRYIEEVIQSLRPHLNRTAIEVNINCAEDFQIFSCPGLYSQIITNLVMNSIVHAFENDKAGIITIDIAMKKNTLHLHYRDNGKGMDSELEKKIFDPFVTTKRGAGGTGLGMHVVYNVITQGLEGTIHCSSTLGQGTEFIIEVPVTLSENMVTSEELDYFPET